MALCYRVGPKPPAHVLQARPIHHPCLRTEWQRRVDRRSPPPLLRHAGIGPPPLPATSCLPTPDPHPPFFFLLNRTPSQPPPSSHFPLCFGRDAAEWIPPHLSFPSHPPGQVQACRCRHPDCLMSAPVVREPSSTAESTPLPPFPPPSGERRSRATISSI
jgi:hypothetical protein